MTDPLYVANLESSLNHFDLAVRTRALEELVSLQRQGAIPVALVDDDKINMHCHTFFSFNAYGHSPLSLAWMAKRDGYKFVGIVDFDVLDGIDEFMRACDIVGVRGSAGIETRVYVPEIATREINSPGEPGVMYHMGIGFTSSQVPAAVAGFLADMCYRATARNQTMVARINAYLKPVTIDYERDVLPLTPVGNVTERHIVLAYIRAAERLIPNPETFWAEKLSIAPQEMRRPVSDATGLQTLIRARLMKRGGAGHTEPTPDMFPTVDEFHQFVEGCDALPCFPWLDGTSAGEESIGELLELLVRKGVVTLNIIPDRNWNIRESQARRRKLEKLYEIVQLAERRGLPLNVGTEMNSFGQKLADDLSVPELVPVRQAFLAGAHVIYGLTTLQRQLGLGYQSEWARTHFPSRLERNRFYAEVGYRVLPGATGMAHLQALGTKALPDEVLLALDRDSGEVDDT